MFRPSSATVTPERARLLLLGAFALSGLIGFSWLARVPSVRSNLGLSAAQLGIILLVGSVGALATVVSSTRILARFGSGRMFAAGAVVMSAGFILMGVGPTLTSVPLFCAGIVLNGIGGALLSVPQNVESARIERAYGRAIIPHFHAAFSAGAVGGSMLGAVGAAAGVPVGIQFSVLGVLAVAARLIVLRAGVILPVSPEEQRSGSPAPRAAGKTSVWAEPGTLLIGVVAFAAALSEGAANNWLALAFVDEFKTSEAIGGIVLFVFIGSMAVARVVGTRVIDRLGRVVALQISGACGFAGVLAFGLSSRPQMAIVGVALWGVGSALCFPIAVAAVSEEPRRAPARVSVMASMGSVAALTTAPLIGVVADLFGGTQHALLVVVVAMLAMLAASRLVGPSLSRVADPREVLAASG